GKLRFFIFQKSTCDRFGVAEIDLRTRRSGGTECDAAELQFLRCGAGAASDQIEGELLGRLIFLFLENFETVDDGADRADQVGAIENGLEVLEEEKDEATKEFALD